MPFIKAKFNTKTGVTSLETEGFIGTGCKDATKELERLLGIASEEKLKNEYYMHQEQGENVLNRMDGGS